MKKTPPPILYPVYDLEALKGPFCCADIRTVRSRLERAGVHIRKMGDRQVVLAEDLVNAALMDKVPSEPRQAQSETSKNILNQHKD